MAGYRRTGSRGPPADPKQRPCIVALAAVVEILARSKGCGEFTSTVTFKRPNTHVRWWWGNLRCSQVPTLVGGRGRGTSTLGPCRPGCFVSCPTYSPSSRPQCFLKWSRSKSPSVSRRHPLPGSVLLAGVKGTRGRGALIRRARHAALGALHWQAISRIHLNPNESKFTQD